MGKDSGERMEKNKSVKQAKEWKAGDRGNVLTRRKGQRNDYRMDKQQ